MKPYPINCVSIVIPVYNEEESLPELLRRTEAACQLLKHDYAIPGNDDAIRAIQLYARAAADAILEGKAAAPAAAQGDANEFVELDEEGNPVAKEERKAAPRRDDRNNRGPAKKGAGALTVSTDGGTTNVSVAAGTYHSAGDLASAINTAAGSTVASVDATTGELKINNGGAAALTFGGAAATTLGLPASTAAAGTGASTGVVAATGDLSKEGLTINGTAIDLSSRSGVRWAETTFTS